MTLRFPSARIHTALQVPGTGSERVFNITLSYFSTSFGIGEVVLSSNFCNRGLALEDAYDYGDLALGSPAFNGKSVTHIPLVMAVL